MNRQEPKYDSLLGVGDIVDETNKSSTFCSVDVSIINH